MVCIHRIVSGCISDLSVRQHLARSAVHNDDSDEEEAEENLYDGWEDDIARLEDEAARSNQTEEEIVFNESDDFTPISREAVMQV